MSAEANLAYGVIVDVLKQDIKIPNDLEVLRYGTTMDPCQMIVIKKSIISANWYDPNQITNLDVEDDWTDKIAKFLEKNKINKSSSIGWYLSMMFYE